MRVLYNNRVVIIVIFVAVKRILSAWQESVNNLDGRRRRRRTCARKPNAFVGRRRPVEFATKKTDLQLQVAAGRALSRRAWSFLAVLPVLSTGRFSHDFHFAPPPPLCHSDFDVTNMSNACTRIMEWERRLVQ